MNDKEILNIKEASAFLKVSSQTLMKMINKGSDIPFFKIGSRYKFDKQSLINWINNYKKNEMGG